MPNEDLNQPVHLQSDESHHCPYEETLHPWISKLHSVKILIRLHERTGYVSMLGTHVRSTFSDVSAQVEKWVI